MTDFKKEWIQKATIDYFSPFISLWSGYNSWFKSHYCEISTKTDRLFIDKIKTDTTPRNQTLTKFKDLMDTRNISKENTEFRANLESLIYSVLQANIFSDRIKKPISFETALIDYSKKAEPAGYANLIKKKRSKDKIKLSNICITDNIEIFFSGLIEIIYQIRCTFVHGTLEPTPQNHEVVKYCYHVLLILIK